MEAVLAQLLSPMPSMFQPRISVCFMLGLTIAGSITDILRLLNADTFLPNIADQSIPLDDSPPLLLLHDKFPPIVVPKGVTFSRNIQRLPPNATYQLQFDGNHCKSRDQYGDNNCHYDWGEVVRGNYSLSLPYEIERGDMMHGDFEIDRLVPYSFACPLCDDPCILTIPVINVNYTIEMPPCPIGPDFSHFVKETLREASPTDGVRTHVEGTVQMHRANGDLMAAFGVSAYVR